MTNLPTDHPVPSASALRSRPAIEFGETRPFVERSQPVQQADSSPRQTTLLMLADISMTAAAALFSPAPWNSPMKLRGAL